MKPVDVVEVRIWGEQVKRDYHSGAKGKQKCIVGFVKEFSALRKKV